MGLIDDVAQAICKAWNTNWRAGPNQEDIDCAEAAIYVLIDWLDENDHTAAATDLRGQVERGEDE